jgi:hypothetical protein
MCECLIINEEPNADATMFKKKKDFDKPLRGWVHKSY